MCLKVIEYNLKEKFNDNYFALNESYEQNNNNKQEDNKKEESVSKIDDVVYPMYLPVNTYLSNQDKVPTEAGERVIMTFAGETPFLLVQETAQMNNITDVVDGNPYLITGTIGAVNDYSVSWINNGIEYNILSDSMNVEQLVTVAESIRTVAIGK